MTYYTSCWQLAIVGALCFAGCSDSESENEQIDIQKANRERFGEIWRVESIASPKGDIGVRISAGGELAIRAGNEWLTVSLDSLGEALGEQRERRHSELRASGLEVFESHHSGAKVSRLRVHVLLDRATPWAQFAWLVRVIESQLIVKVDLSVGESHVRLELPLAGSYQEHSPSVQTTIEVNARGFVPEQWGSTRVRVPEIVSFKLLALPATGSVQGLTRHVREAVALAKRERLVRLDTTTLTFADRVPSHVVLDVLSALRGAGVTRVDLLKLPDIPSGAKAMLTLPYPE